jgi:hypothetical protein
MGTTPVPMMTRGTVSAEGAAAELRRRGLLAAPAD